MDIDFVILWVDGSDPDWLREKSKYQGVEYDESNSVNRFRDWGLLPYWFRAVEKFAPWVRKVHFVTCGHKPEWLNVDSPKVNFVKHSDFIPEEYLPTFSSHAIEMNIHRIPDLAEHFVYFNDDMFLLREMKEEDFFKNGLPCTCGTEVPLRLYGSVGIWQHAIANNLGIINKHFTKKEAVARYGKKYTAKCNRWQDNVRTKVLEKLYPDYFTGFANLHAPGMYLKSVFEEIWEKEYDLLDFTSRSRFRNSDSVNQWVCLWWQVASGRFEPKVIDNLIWEINDDLIGVITEAITTQSNDFICLNDGEDDADVDRLSVELRKAFEFILPDKSQFEY